MTEKKKKKTNNRKKSDGYSKVCMLDFGGEVKRGGEITHTHTHPPTKQSGFSPRVIRLHEEPA